MTAERNCSEENFENFEKTLCDQLDSFLKLSSQLDPDISINTIDPQHHLSLFENPAYVIQIAHAYLIEQPEVAKKMLTHAYEMDPILGHIALYYRALASIQIGHKKFKEENKRLSIHDKIEEEAIEDYNQAIANIEELIAYLGGVLTLGETDPASLLSQQFNNKILLLNQFKCYCSKEISFINEFKKIASKDDKEGEAFAKCVVCFQPPFVPLDTFYNDFMIQLYDIEKGDEAKKENRSPPTEEELKSSEERKELIAKTVAPFEEIDELSNCGLRRYYELGFAQPETQWWEILLLAGIGAVQFAAGVALCIISGGKAAKFAIPMMIG